VNLPTRWLVILTGFNYFQFLLSNHNSLVHHLSFLPSFQNKGELHYLFVKACRVTLFYFLLDLDSLSSLLSRSVMETNYFSGSNVNNLCKKITPFVMTFQYKYGLLPIKLFLPSKNRQDLVSIHYSSSNLQVWDTSVNLKRSKTRYTAKQ
jgi:hypothetical protein